MATPLIAHSSASATASSMAVIAASTSSGARTAIAQRIRPSPASVCQCRRGLSSKARRKAAAVASAADLDPLLLTPEASGSSSSYPAYLEKAYRSRYRDPEKHESPVTRLPLGLRYRPAELQHTWLTSTAPHVESGASSHSYQSSYAAYAPFNAEQRTTDSRRSQADVARSGAGSPAVDVRTSSLRQDASSRGRSYVGPTSPQKSSSTSAGHTSRSARPPRKTALLFPGSGSQYVGMSQFLIDNFQTGRDVWEEAEDALAHFEEWRKDLKLHELPELRHLDLLNWKTWQTERSEKELKHIVSNGPQDELTRSSNAQPSIIITSAALLRVLEKDFGVPISDSAAYFAGHSSGEYSACVASRAITFSEGVKLTRLHGLLTSRTLQLSSLKTYSDHDATDEERAQMSAIVLQDGADIKDVQRIVRETNERYPGNAGMVEVASYNSSRQVVLSGSRAGVLTACDKLRDKDIASRAADLPVFAPFHCSFMAPAAHGMAYAWSHGVKAKAPIAPIVSNLDAGLIRTPERLQRDIVASIHKPVLWAEALDLMRKDAVSRFVFIGPGKALANLAKKEVKTGRWKQYEDELEIASVATMKDFEVVSELCQDLQGGLESRAKSDLQEASM